MKTYIVYDNNKPAVLNTKTFSSNTFATLKDAKEYVNLWLGFDVDISFEEKYDYSGYGDIIEIRSLFSEEDK